MIVHRDYKDSSASIIKIFDNKIEFYNPGNLYGGITIKDLLSGNYSSKTRNKLIAKAFKEIGLIERYGSGIMRVRRICKEYGIIEPKFEEIFNGFRVILFKEKIIDTGNDTGNDTDNDTERGQKIISLIRKDSKITINQIARNLSVSRSTILRDINKLKANGVLERLGSEKGGHWELTNP